MALQSAVLILFSMGGQSIHDFDEHTVEVAAMAIFASMRPSLRWEVAKPETQKLCREAARQAIGTYRLGLMVEEERAKHRRKLLLEDNEVGVDDLSGSVGLPDRL